MAVAAALEWRSLSAAADAMPPDSIFTSFRSLRTRLLLWNAGAVALTGIVILLTLRAGVRFTLIADLDQVLREDLAEIKLHFSDEGGYDWETIKEELNHRAEGHDFHRWFVRFFDENGHPTWSSKNTPDLPPPTKAEKEEGAYTLNDYRLSYARFVPPVPEASYACVGCSQRYVARDMASIDRLVLGTGFLVLLASPIVGQLLTSRTIQPLAQMIQTTARLHPGQFGERLPIRGTGDELDSLAHTINGLLDRIASYLQQKHDFLANAAHDLRTPLAAIRSSVEVALGGQRSDAEYREIMGVVIDQCTSLQMLVNQLLLLAESDADRLQIDREPVALDQVVALVLEMFEGVAEERGVELRSGLIEPAAVPGNRHHLRQVVSNLLDNAIKFTSQVPCDGANKNRGHVLVELLRDANSGVVRLTVQDNGAGIAGKDLPHVFDRFYRADKGRGRDGVATGSGLGLSICKAIIDAHGGEIQAESEASQGTTFTVTLPMAASASFAASFATSDSQADLA